LVKVVQPLDSETLGALGVSGQDLANIQVVSDLSAVADLRNGVLRQSCGMCHRDLFQFDKSDVNH